MTELEQMRARALDRCTFIPGSFEKRFAQDMAAKAKCAPKLFLSDKQRACLVKMCWRFRKQLQRNGDGHVVPAENPYPKNEAEGEEEDSD